MVAGWLRNDRPAPAANSIPPSRSTSTDTDRERNPLFSPTSNALETVVLKRIVIIGLLLSGTPYRATAGESFEVTVDHRFVGPVLLKGGRLLAIDRTLEMTRSADQGRTWTSIGPLRDAAGQVIMKGNVRPWTLLRLQSGAIAVTFDIIPPGQESGLRKEAGSFFSQSRNEGKTWLPPIRVTWPGSPANPTWLIQTRKGRLVLPNEYWRTQPMDRGLGVCTAFYSDDQGRSWQESRDSLWVWENGGRQQGSCEVPTVVETSDGRLLMFMRTSFQRIARSESRDGGRTWSAVKLTSLLSSNSEIFLDRLPESDTLLCVWNQASKREIETGYYRARLTSAISRDHGTTWTNFRTLASSPGQAPTTRIPAVEPIAFLKTQRAIPRESEMLAREFHMNRAPRLRVIGESAYLIYTHRRYHYDSGKMKRTVNQTRLRMFPVSWFSSTKPAQ